MTNPQKNNCCSCNEEGSDLNADGLCSDCATEAWACRRTRCEPEPSERHLSTAWQEEQNSARHEDRYGTGYDPYEDD